MASPLDKLALDHWYKVLMAGGFAVFLLAGAGLLHALPVKPTLLISLGVFFFGLGEWRNHPLQQRVGIGFKITGHPRSASLGGVIFDVIGLALIATGVFYLLR